MMPTLFVNSIGRSGSDIFWRAALDANSKDRRYERVLKTHWYPDNVEMKTDDLVVFLFADPVHVALSFLRFERENVFYWQCNLQGRDFLLAAAKNLGVPMVRDFNRLLSEDVFQLERMFDAYGVAQRFKMLHLRYPDVYILQEQVRLLTALPSFSLPEFKAREALSAARFVSEEEMSMVLETYREFRQKVISCAPLRFWEKHD